jgi:hypothetical protein
MENMPAQQYHQNIIVEESIVEEIVVVRGQLKPRQGVML